MVFQLSNHIESLVSSGIKRGGSNYEQLASMPCCLICFLIRIDLAVQVWLTGSKSRRDKLLGQRRKLIQKGLGQLCI